VDGVLHTEDARASTGSTPLDHPGYMSGPDSRSRYGRRASPTWTGWPNASYQRLAGDPSGDARRSRDDWTWTPGPMTAGSDGAFRALVEREAGPVLHFATRPERADGLHLRPLAVPLPHRG
jgi:hypothetical protein